MGVPVCEERLKVTRVNSLQDSLTRILPLSWEVFYQVF